MTARRLDLLARGSRAPDGEREDRVRINLYMDNALFRRIRDCAVETEASVSSTACDLIEDALAARDLRDTRRS